MRVLVVLECHIEIWHLLLQVRVHHHLLMLHAGVGLHHAGLVLHHHLLLDGNPLL